MLLLYYGINFQNSVDVGLCLRNNDGPDSHLLVYTESHSIGNLDTEAQLHNVVTIPYLHLGPQRPSLSSAFPCTFFALNWLLLGLPS